MGNWLSHAEFVALIVTIIGSVYVMDGKIERQAERLDKHSQENSVRTDRLYEMFIELVKNKDK